MMICLIERILCEFVLQHFFVNGTPASRSVRCMVTKGHTVCALCCLQLQGFDDRVDAKRPHICCAGEDHIAGHPTGACLYSPYGFCCPSRWYYTVFCLGLFRGMSKGARVQRCGRQLISPLLSTKHYEKVHRLIVDMCTCVQMPKDAAEQNALPGLAMDQDSEAVHACCAAVSLISSPYYLAINGWHS